MSQSLALQEYLPRRIRFGLLLLCVLFILVLLFFVQLSPYSFCVPHSIASYSSRLKRQNQINGSLLSSSHTDFPWTIERPVVPPVTGWEDEWMIAWKHKRYRPSEVAKCGSVGSELSPFDDGFLCELPAYVPPRAVPLGPQKITRVIFQSFMYHKMSMTQYVHFSSWIALNPTYEFILFDDDDVDDFICENFSEDISQPFSRLVAGAAKTDFWRALVIEKYGGVYLDADLLAVAPLPISANDNIVTGLGCWNVVKGLSPGVFEHWSMAFSPHHRLPNLTISFILAHLNDAEWYKNVILTTGPGPYQQALHMLLAEAKCEPEFCSYARQPNFRKEKCDEKLFLQVFGTTRILESVNFNDTYANKLFETSEYSQFTFNQKHYDEERYTSSQIDAFCELTKRDERKQTRTQRWAEALVRQKEREEARDREELLAG